MEALGLDVCHPTESPMVVLALVLQLYLSEILATLITSLDDKSIFEAYKLRFDKLPAKGFKPKLNVMDSQATKYIKQFLTKKECKLQLVEPHNKRVNAAEQAIQTFKDALIAKEEQYWW